MRDFFIICCNLADTLNELSDSERGRLFTACIEYVEHGKVTELRGNERFVFSGIKASIDREMEAEKNDAFDAEFDADFDAIDAFFDASNASLPSSPPTPPLLPISLIPPKEKDSKESKKKAPRTDAEFNEFWSHYPRKVCKKAARKSFDKVDVPVEVLIDALERHKKSDQWRKDNGQFIPHPATWLNNARWEDELNLTDTTRPNRPRSYRVEWVDGEEVVCFDP